MIVTVQSLLFMCLGFFVVEMEVGLMDRWTISSHYLLKMIQNRRIIIVH